MSINNYIESHGEPDAIVFSFDKDSYYAIWGFDDILTIDINQASDESLSYLQTKIDNWIVVGRDPDVKSIGQSEF